MKNFTVKLALYINYFVFAILLNSVGIVILKAQRNYGVNEIDASILEAFKDLPIAIVSFLIASFLPRVGYKKAMMAGLFLVIIGCLVMFYGNSFLAAKVLFAIVGASFAIIKVAVYAVIGLVTSNEKEHNSLMSSIEGVFMLGIATAYFLFPFFNNEQHQEDWLNVYWFLAGLIIVSMLFLWKAKFKGITLEPSKSSLLEDFSKMFALLSKLMILIFIISAFLFVMVEQGIMTWLPTFYDIVLGLPQNVSIMMASVLAISLAAGRLLAGVLVKRINWIWILSTCILLAMAMVWFVLPKTIEVKVGEISSLFDVPLIGFAFPLIGLFIAPIYPLLNSTVLSALPKERHSAMTGLIVVFSALGGTLGSRIIGWLFKNQGADHAFYYTLIPMVLLLVLFFILKKMTQNAIQTE